VPQLPPEAVVPPPPPEVEALLPAEAEAVDVEAPPSPSRKTP